MTSTDHSLHCDLSASILVGDPLVDNFQPRTELGRKLIELRRIYIQNGGKLLTWDELDEEMCRRRGGVFEVSPESFDIEPGKP
ncbi:hypothetical protein CCP4SC76_650007 [Gammaproteobacteria bacterium]